MSSSSPWPVRREKSEKLDRLEKMEKVFPPAMCMSSSCDDLTTCAHRERKMRVRMYVRTIPVGNPLLSSFPSPRRNPEFNNGTRRENEELKWPQLIIRLLPKFRDAFGAPPFRGRQIAYQLDQMAAKNFSPASRMR